jgi:RHS repeat-associated protein
VLSETTGSATSAYVYAGGPLEIDQSGTTYWYLTDTLGSVRLLTDSTGASPATYAYSAFGSTRASTGTIANEVRFSGERTDTESGLEFLRARTYDPATGTFLQRDSWGITPTDSQSIDLYLYTGSDPADELCRTGDKSVGAIARDLDYPRQRSAAGSPRHRSTPVSAKDSRVRNDRQGTVPNAELTRRVLVRTAGLPAAGLDEVDDLLLRRRGQVQAGAAEPADRPVEGAKAVVFRGRDHRDRQMASRDDRSNPTLCHLHDERGKGGPGIGYADRP